MVWQINFKKKKGGREKKQRIKKGNTKNGCEVYKMIEHYEKFYSIHLKIEAIILLGKHYQNWHKIRNIKKFKNNRRDGTYLTLKKLAVKTV